MEVLSQKSRISGEQTPKRPRWIRRHPLASVFLAVLTGFVLLNVSAYRHAYHMTHFAPAGKRPPGLQELSLGGKAWVALTGVEIPRPANWLTPGSFAMNYEVRHFPAADGKDLEAWYVPCREPKGIVLLFHGYAGVKSTLLAQASAFRGIGYDALLIDFRGNGGSGGDDTTIGVREAEDVETTYAYARQQWPDRPVVLFGVSMGSAAILRALSLHHIEPEATVIETPFDRLLTTVEHRVGLMHLPTFPIAQMLVFWGGCQCGFSGFEHNPVDYARSVKSPVLILHGDQDPFVTVPEVRSIYDNLAGEKQIEIFAGAGHQALFESRAKDWGRLVSAFLDKHVPGEKPNHG